MIRYLRLLSMAGALALCHFPTTADAFWGRSFGSGGGSAGSYGSGGGSWGGSVGGSIGGSTGGSSGGYVAASHSHGGSVGGSSGHHVGPLKRLFAAIRSRHVARRAQHGSSGGSTGGSSGGSTGYVAYSSHGGSSGGSVGGASYGGSSGGYAVASYGSSGGAVAHSHSVPMAAPMTIDSGYGYESSVIDPSHRSEGDSGPSVMDSGEAATASPEDSSRRAPSLNQDSALLTVAVPENATVTVNGHETKSEGSIRQFMSRGLQEGYVYTYVVNVDYTINGEKKSDSKSIKLRPGDTERVVFDATANVQQDVASEAKPASSKTDLVTEVKIHVPAGATVKLAGNETVGNGEVRTFRTKQLKSGENWDGYKVQVIAEINGRSISKERTVNLAAGSSTELFFDFEGSSIAKN